MNVETNEATDEGLGGGILQNEEGRLNLRRYRISPLLIVLPLISISLQSTAPLIQIPHDKLGLAMRCAYFMAEKSQTLYNINVSTLLT